MKRYWLFLPLLTSQPVFASPPPATAARFDHIAINVADLAASVAFYRDVFGLKSLPVPIAGPHWLDLGNGGALHLIPGRKVSVADNRFVHLALATADLAPIIAKLKAAGIAYTDAQGAAGAISTGRSDGAQQIFLRDPDGYWLEVNDTLRKR